MSVTQLLTIIILILFSKIISLNAENHPVQSEKITLKKCCPLGKYIYRPRKRICKPYLSEDNLDFSDLKLYNEDMHLTNRSVKDLFELESGIFEQNLNFKQLAMDYSFRLKLNSYLTETGTLYLEAPNEAVRWRNLNSSSFCVDYLLFKDNMAQKASPSPRFWAILPYEERNSGLDPLYVTIGMLTSCVFLALVLVVYSLLPELRNLSGLVLMAYVASLFTAFLLLAVLQIGAFPRLACRLLTYSFYFSILASFCWMNIMSYDIWWTFRGFVKARPIHRFGEWFKFKVYCAYAFGVPLGMTIFFVTVDVVPMRHLPWFITPNLLRKGCFLEGEEKLPYLYAPMLIMILMNWLFFLMTSFEIWSLHRQTAILDTAAAGTRAAHRQHRTRLLVYLKLSIIMGVNWVLEVVSYFTPTLHIWVVSDAYNFLIGISIFLIFICKRKILRKLKMRYRAWREPDALYIGNKSHSSHTTNSDVSQEVPLQVCPHPHASYKHRNF